MSVATFIKNYNNKYLEDTGAYVSKGFNTFQNAFKREMKGIAESIGARLVSFNKGHYDMSGFIERDGHYVYFSYSRILDRSTPDLTSYGPMYCRTAKDAKDYCGGTNCNTSFKNCAEDIDRLLKSEHKPF